MKANLKGLGGIKHFFVAHGEKLGILIVGICALLMIYRALGRDKLPAEKEAGKLNERITLARQNMEGFTWDRFKKEFPGEIREARPLTQKGGSVVNAGSYQTEHADRPWDPPVVPPIVLRADPLLLEAQAVEANGGSGLLAFVDPAVRRQKMLEEQKKAKELDNKQKKEQEKQQKEGEKPGGRNKSSTRGGREDTQYGATVFDPEHPKRRPVVGMVRPRGVALQDYEEVRVAHWAVVVAKIPIKEQLKLYRDALEKSRDYKPMADIPQYLGYFVERAEIRPGEENQKLNWVPVFVENGKGQRIGTKAVVNLATLFGTQDPAATSTTATTSVTSGWSTPSQEIVDSRYLGGGVLAFPLPPLVGRDWGSDVTHSEIPLAIDAAPEEETPKPDEKKPAADAEGDMFAGGAAAAGGAMAGRQSMMGGGPGGYGEGRGGGGYGEGRGGGGYGGRGGGEYGRAMMGGMGRGGEGGYGGGEGGYGGGGYAGGQGGLDQNGEPKAADWLLRFFDFSVEPGKKYRYRVRLAMLDPNQTSGAHVVELDSLDKDALIRVRKAKADNKSRLTPVRLTEWSKPSRTVTIPLAGSVSVASAKPATDQFNSEPKTSLLVQSFGADEKGNAIQAAKEKEFERGGVANMTEDTEVLADQGRAIDPYKAFNFQTDITVADILGGERLTRKDTRPARILLMGPAGQLFVQDETSDAEVVEMHHATFAKEPPGGAAGGFMGGEGAYGGRGGGPPPGYGGGARGGGGR